MTSADADAGFTLVEALVALALLGALVLGGVTAASRALRTQARAEVELHALALADEMLQAAEVLPLDSLYAHREPRRGTATVHGRPFRWSLAAAPEPDRERLWRVVAVVVHDRGEVRLETLLFRRIRPVTRAGPAGRDAP